jgi:hypothetical protein
LRWPRRLAEESLERDQQSRHTRKVNLDLQFDRQHFAYSAKCRERPQRD